MNTNLFEKPWGRYEVLYQDDTVVLKRIEVDPQQMPSYQSHQHRNEFWVVTQGSGVVIIDGRKSEISTSNTVVILKNQKHRVINTGDVTLEFYELQFGDECREDDIIRYDDIYGRRTDEKEQT